jgi:hypothetical protein
LERWNLINIDRNCNCELCSVSADIIVPISSDCQGSLGQRIKKGELKNFYKKEAE